MPVRYRVHGRYALGRPAGERIHPRIPFGYLAAMSVMIVGARLRGEHRLSPFFERRSGSPVAVPRILGC